MNIPALDLSATDTAAGDWRVVVESIGDADASLLSAIRQISPLPEAHLAMLLYQAPSVLVAGLERETAEAVHEVLAGAGLDCRVAAAEADFEPGDSRHELALVVRDVRRMPEVGKLVIEVMGVDVTTARKLLCTSPTVILGRLSAGTAAALKRRFEALQVEAVVSRVDDALYDVFLGHCSSSEHPRAVQALRTLGIELGQRSDNGDQAPATPLVATGLAKAEADRLWERLARTNLPIRVINRDFERFDVRLEEAPDSPEMVEFLVATAGMPEAVACKVVRRTPLVSHLEICYDRMGSCLEEIHRLGGKATADLLAFQSFALTIVRLGDREASSSLLRALAEIDEPAAFAALQASRVDGPLTRPQARWLQWELRRVGTETKMELR